jgi:hypothetical protein
MTHEPSRQPVEDRTAAAPERRDAQPDDRDPTAETTWGCGSGSDRGRGSATWSCCAPLPDAETESSTADSAEASPDHGG